MKRLQHYCPHFTIQNMYCKRPLPSVSSHPVPPPLMILFSSHPSSTIHSISRFIPIYDPFPYYVISLFSLNIPSRSTHPISSDDDSLPHTGREERTGVSYHGCKGGSSKRHTFRRLDHGPRRTRHQHFDQRFRSGSLRQSRGFRGVSFSSNGLNLRQ